MTHPTAGTSPDDPIRRQVDPALARLWLDLVAAKWLVAATIAVFVAAGVAYAFLAPRWYRAEVLLAPQKDDSRSRLAGQFGGLASLAGINLGGGEDVEPLAVLRSRTFARSFIADEGLMPVLLAKRWDAERRAWKGPQSKWPDERDAVKVFDEDVRHVVEDKKTGLITLAIEWKDPDTAARWANLAVDRLNAQLRAKAIAEAEQNVKFLRGEIASNDVVPLQQSIARLLEMEMQKLMLARGKAQFAFKVVDVAVPPKKAVRPQKLLVVLLATLLGVFCSVLLVAMRRWRRSLRQLEPS